MKIIKSNIEEIFRLTGYEPKEKYQDSQLNSLFNSFCVFEEKENEIIKAAELSLSEILYSKYYWFSMLKACMNKLYGEDAGLAQQQFKIIDEITQRAGAADWRLLEKIETETAKNLL